MTRAYPNTAKTEPAKDLWGNVVMPPYTIGDLEHADLDHAVRVADRIWWVGHRQENDLFRGAR